MSGTKAMNNIEIADYLSLAYGDNVRVILDRYVFTWDYLENGLKIGQILTLDGRDIFGVQISEAVDIYDENDIIGTAIFTKEHLDKLYSVAYTNANTTVRIERFTRAGTIEHCKVQASRYSKERPSLILITSGKRYNGIFDDNGRIQRFYRG